MPRTLAQTCYALCGLTPLLVAASAAAAADADVVTFPIEGFAGVGEVARFPLVAGQDHRCGRQ